MYPDSLCDSIAIVDATREKRKGEELLRLTSAEMEGLLRRYHPDYREAGFRNLRIGANRGDRTTHEIADLLEAFSNLDHSKISLEPEFDTDVLVLGGGGAGVTAALFAESMGARVILATKLRVGNSNTIMALGGMQASVHEDDSPVRHFADTMGAGKFAGKRELVKTMVEDGPAIVKWLLELGVDFDRDEEGNLATRKAGGITAPRIISIGDYTGLNIMKVLKDEIRKGEGIEVMEFAPAVELTTNGFGECNGAVLFDLGRKRHFTVRARAVVLATGGSGRLHFQGFPSSNNFGATGDAIVLAYRAGARLEGIDSFQYHPTGVMFPDHMVGVLVTEAARSLGGQLVNGKGERFINELETRDACSAAIIRECEEGNGVRTPAGKVGVWLDTPLIEETQGKGFLKRRFPSMYRHFMRVKIDISKRPLLTYPTLHYQNGGILIDEKGETTVRNLFTAGEAAGGIHGRNRAMGNSLLDIFVFGRRAGLAAAKRKYSEPGNVTLGHVYRYYDRLKSLRISSVATSPTLFPEFIVSKL
ncbi:fumarate reductase/succinate dehydrogenase flavoprotein domain protein [Geobacter metallireducens RCH3]|uniref:Oxidoreductase, flavin-binding protein n=1 Tax=Geobacter metallireducens (strain ATCC 53774 / DSM 7210 / GS-15) TaxID=269799 RepID=Q39RJ5_GEOMG|nr:FAD-binding protein [Geobacter metallireducens]ABB33129.1 oxidoreductase, flavin-binding protein [Geobacter metallireducens GS-15]EHP87128.1 fumarate reductase/succinate dehydrogenase flavoprotein domain protein [Geobacter metallireducens RCH3]